MEWRIDCLHAGTGIIKEFLKQDIATNIFNESLPILTENKVTQKLLEVIKTSAAYEPINKFADSIFFPAGLG